MASPRLQLGGFAGGGDGLLFLEDGGGGLEGEAAEDGFAVADAAPARRRWQD